MLYIVSHKKENVMNVFIVVNVLIIMGSIICAMVWRIRYVKWQKILKNKETERTKIYEAFQNVSMCYDKDAVMEWKKNLDALVDDFSENTTDYNKRILEFEYNELHKKLMEEYRSAKSRNEILEEQFSDMRFDKMVRNTLNE